MTLCVNSNYSASRISNVKGLNQTGKIAFKANLDGDSDIVEFSKPEGLSVEEKQKMIKKARATAAGWSAFGGLFSALYYNFRSDEKVAKKFDLNLENDQKLVKQIKKEQAMWALTGTFGFGIIGYIVANCLNSKNIEID